ncbi:hypothetical protein GF312_12650 [Candidatus Poribacteria bacterium]|nr:hypothetical protein [Candidatus Poribacteria bacterium]
MNSSFIKRDIFVITAANEYQADGYKRQIQWRKERGYLPPDFDFHVIHDPKGRRVGSGGSTIYTLYRLLEDFCRDDNFDSIEDAFVGKRIWILHSGGDSKRLPAYSPFGKVFIPLPVEREFDRPVALFDLILENLIRLPIQDKGQMVIASGDVLLSYNNNELVFSHSGITGVAYPGAVDVASRHGVYITEHRKWGDNLREVMDFLQKPSPDELKSSVDIAGKALVDTGIINFNLDSISALLHGSGVYLGNGKPCLKAGSLCEGIMKGEAELDIYREIPFMLLGKNGNFHDRGLWDVLRRIPYHVCVLSYCEFFHLGTSQQFLQEFHTTSYTSSAYNFQNFTRTNVSDFENFRKAFVYNTNLTGSKYEIGGMCIIEGCDLRDISLKGGNIVTGVIGCDEPLKLKRDTCLSCIPVGKGNWVSLIYGVKDSFKGDLEDGTTFMNQPLRDWIGDKGVKIDELWDKGKSHDIHDIWEAWLFPVSHDLDETLSLVLELQDGITQGWLSSERISMSQVLSSVDYSRLWESRIRIIERTNLEKLDDIVVSEKEIPTEDILFWCKNPQDYLKAAGRILHKVDNTGDLILKGRLYKLLGSIIKSSPETDFVGLSSAQEYESMAFDSVRKAVKTGLDLGYTSQKMSIRSDEVVWVCVPSRLDFAGGWSDTPPYCLEYGGNVLNASVKLNGQYPIQAIGKCCKDRAIKINSIDLSQQAVVYQMDEMLSCQNPGNWQCLPKAAFVASGVIPEDIGCRLEDILAEIGCGIELTTFSAVPAGSGLGTSSILGSAVIACLSRMFDRELTQVELFNRTMYMEQLMTTGGGWQDQVGGVIGGVKLISTQPGYYQNPLISWTDLVCNDDNTGKRFLLYYTGMRRTAKNILQNIVGGYLDREPNVIKTIHQLKQISMEMKEQLDARDIESFGENISRVWELNKALDPGTSNGDIEAIFDRIEDLIYGAKLLGAGGGGFLFIVTKGAKKSEKIRKILIENPPNNRARFFDFQVDYEGLRVNVL